MVASNPAYSSTNGVLFDKTQTFLIQCPGGLGGSYTIPGSVISIGNDAFDDCINLTNIIVGNGVTTIGDYAFLSCSSLTSVSLGNSVSSIGTGMFEYCSSLAGITIPNSVTNIGQDAFALCSSLSRVTIGSRVTTIGNLAFYSCALTAVTIPGSVTNIGNYAFEYCSDLANITFLGNAPELVGLYAFSDLASGAKVYYYAGTSGWSSTFNGLPAIQLIAPPQISDASLQNGNFGFAIGGVNNQLVTVVASTNLLNWQTIWTNTLSGTSTNFTDTQSRSYPRRFYRAY